MNTPGMASLALPPPPPRVEAAPLTVPAHVAARRATIPTMAVGGALAAYAGLFWLVRTKRSEAFDLAWMIRVQRRRRPWLDRLMTAVSWPGFSPQSRLIPSAIISALWLAGFRRESGFLTIAWGSAVISSGLKTLMNRPRPVAGQDLRVVIAPLGGSSFPSGHVLTFVGTYGFAAFLAATLLRPQSLRFAAVGSSTALIVLVGPSRIYQGHHWPTDVTASYLVGFAWLLAVIAGYQRAALADITGPPVPSGGAR